jgi:hypothetical protein
VNFIHLRAFLSWEWSLGLAVLAGSAKRSADSLSRKRRAIFDACAEDSVFAVNNAAAARR